MTIISIIQIVIGFIGLVLIAIPFSQNTETPCDTCASIIDLLASNPTTLIIDPQAKVDGRGNIEANKALGGGFEVTIPFVLQLSPMTFMGGKNSFQI